MAHEIVSPQPSSAMLANARALQLAAWKGQTPLLLKGKKLALLCVGERAPENDLFLRAAAELGAHVARIPPSLVALSAPPQELRHTARLLGRLYDAVQCEGVPPLLVRRIADEADVPVYVSIASPDHPCTKLVDRFDGDATRDDKRRFLLQAVLVGSIV
jgi:ornithine carbamoyltransferase